MLFTRTYYLLKPLLPWGLRIAVRRFFARHIRERSHDIWPIDPDSANPPPNWPGWPGGKQFAVVLTHDVEGPLGVERLKSLVQLEQQLGFRSSFNFIPEGSYTVAPELRHWLTERGFEVGVHDLHHDGKLYRSHESFRRSARQINHYLKEWGAVGFRSGFMLRQLNWLHNLDALYDGSSFDTDPFEPQPQGVGTIFPFWMSRGGDQGYCELPYTLCQDSTLYLLLKESGPDIWLKKVDWVAAHGGMVLLNTHPDYIRFGGGNPGPREFPAEWYAALLNRLRERYADRLWLALPHEVAAFCRQHRFPPPRRHPLRIAMVTHSFYESDNRVMRYAEALANRGDYVEVLALGDGHDRPRKETLRDVRVTRIQRRVRRRGMGRLSFLLPLLRFCTHAGLRLAFRHWRQPYDFVHAHNVPDFVVFTAWAPRLSGVPVILDIHDIVPEFYASKFRVDADRPIICMLQRVERAACHFASHVIISNHLWRDRLVSRSVPDRQCSVVINHVDPAIFGPRPRATQSDRCLILFPGGLQWHQGLDIAIKAFGRVATEFPQADFHIYGEGDMKDDLVQLAKDLGLDGRVRIFDGVSLREIADIMANADLGVVPKRANSFGNEAYSTKIMEFMSLGVPVIVSKTKIDTYYFADSVVRFFESGSESALAEAFRELIPNANLRREQAARARLYAEANNWDRKRPEYLGLVDSLVLGGGLKVGDAGRR